jgi:hypothetical protein
LSLATQRKQGPKTPNVCFYPPISEQLLLLENPFCLSPRLAPLQLCITTYLPTYFPQFLPLDYLFSFLVWPCFAVVHHKCLPIIIGTFKIIIINKFCFG